MVTRKVMDRLGRKYDVVKKGTAAVAIMVRQKIQSRKRRFDGMLSVVRKLDRTICSKTTKVNFTKS